VQALRYRSLRESRCLSRFYTDFYIDENPHARRDLWADQYRVIAALKIVEGGGRAAYQLFSQLVSSLRNRFDLWDGPVPRSAWPVQKDRPYSSGNVARDRYGTIKVVRSTEVPSPTISVYA
jgi:hypothetical protein